MTYICLLPSSPHIIRASLMPVKHVDPEFFSLPPERMPPEMRFEDEKLLSEFKNLLPDSLRTPTFSNTVGIMRWLSSRFSNTKYMHYNWVPESPDIIELYLKKKIRGSCYNDAIIFSTFAQSIGLKSRIIALDDRDGWGGIGHSIASVWSEEHQKWVLIDQQQCALFYNSTDNIPLSMMELRKILLENPVEKIEELVRIEQTSGFNVAKKNMIAWYKSLAVDYVIIANSDFYTAKKTSFKRAITSFVEESEPYFGEYAVWFGRFLRAQIGDSFIRYRYQDENTPHHYFTLWYLIYRLVWAILIICISYFFIYGLRWWIRNRHDKINSHKKYQGVFQPNISKKVTKSNMTL